MVYVNYNQCPIKINKVKILRNMKDFVQINQNWREARYIKKNGNMFIHKKKISDVIQIKNNQKKKCLERRDLNRTICLKTDLEK